MAWCGECGGDTNHTPEECEAQQKFNMGCSIVLGLIVVVAVAVLTYLGY